MATGAAQLIVSVDDGIGWIVVDNPAKRNAMTSEMFRALSATCDAWNSDPAVRVVVIRGAGEQSFISGGDIAELRADTVARPRAEEAFPAVAAGLGAIDKPVIAMIHGYCLGGGIAVAIAADIRYCADDAVFGIPAARLGVAYPHDDTARLVSLLGPAHAAELLYGAGRISAAEAARIGLVNRVLPKAELEEAVRTLAGTIAANAPLSHRAHKLSMRLAAGGGVGRHGVDEAIAAAWQSNDFVEGRTAFLERRDPRFAGR